MHVKICGVTTIDDALAAIDAGADMLGFNFYPKSPRLVTTDNCRAIVSAISQVQSPVTTVGVFVNEAPEHMLAVLDKCGLHLAQVHGDEPPEIVADLGGRGYKGLRGTTDTRLAEFAAASRGAPALLVDSYKAGLYGGTGETGDWTAAEAIAARFPILLAGGLRPENAARAIAQVRPWGVDTASGVESSPGRKDAKKMRAFIAAAREAEAAQSQLSTS